MKSEGQYRELIVGNYEQVIAELEKNMPLEDDATILALAYALKHDDNKSGEILGMLHEEDLTKKAKIAYYNARAINSYFEEEYEKAMSFAEKSLALDIQDYFALRTQGNIHMINKENTEALSCFKRILSFNPEAESIKYVCIGIYWLQRDRQAALKMNATLKPSLKKHIDLLLILFLGNNKSTFLFILFLLIFIIIPLTRQVAFALFSLVGLIMIILSLIAKHRFARIAFLIVELVLIVVYLLGPIWVR